MKRLVLGLSCVALFLLGNTAPASAQLTRVLTLNRQAMDAYDNLDLENAVQLLNQAVSVAEENGVTGRPLAQTYLNLGVVMIGGFSDNGQGLQYFSRALEIDGSVALDPLRSSPDIQAMFTLAKNRAGSGGGGATPPEPASGGGGGGAGNIPHTPVREQLSNTAVPVFVDVPDDAPVDKMYVYYRSTGMREYQRVEMSRMQGGFGYEIPCTDVFQPKVEYYLVAFASDGSPLGFAGTEDQPLSVPIVGERSVPPPSLPGRAPPAQCSDRECPPGMSCGSGGLGDTCTADGDCGAGLSCEDNFCVSGDDDAGDDGDMPRFFVRAGFTLGIGLAQSGRPADSSPQDPDGLCDAVPDPNPDDASMGTYEDCRAGRTNGEGEVVYNADGRYAGVLAPQNTSYVPSNSNIPGEDCSAGSDEYCVRLENPGLLPTYALRLELGYWIVPRFAVSGTVRFQFDAGRGTLSRLLLGLRGHVQLTTPSATGLNANVFLGTSYGQIQLKPPQKGANEPYIISGFNGVQLGGSIGYRFMRNFGIYATPEIHLLFPTFLFNVDVTAGVEVAF